MGGILSAAGPALQGIGSIFGPMLGSLFSPGPTGASPFATYGAGLLTSGGQRPPGQTYPGAFYPQQGQGMAYNYIPTGQPGADVAAQQQLAYNQGTGLTAENLANPMLATLLRNFMNDPNMAGLASAGQQAGAMAGQAAGPTFAQGQALNQNIMAALPQMQAILAQGTDPQGALYNRTLQQLNDQMGASLAQQGLTGSGQGGAITNQGLSNFNIDWQNQQLSRALSALQGYGGAIGQAAQGLAAGQGLEAAGIQEAMQAGALPYQAGQTAMGGQQQALANFLNAITQGQNIGGQNFGQALNYLGTGQQANQLAGQAAAGQYGAINQRNAAAAAGLAPLLQTGLSGIGQGLSGLWNLFNTPSSSNSLYAGGYSGGLGAGTTPTGADY